ncbi:hypothetical protein N656DRAFT_578660 [Canariomyces notabilis]|uniref:Uncharacterized protein n=1 Tax=Canariomyces notabilis TaxID=2074819 RepID=A0AAN6TGX8_9PEZI|nr:hypothetical protein N656DRAFT_578660 [Canariomyces arenarius]
MGFSLRYVSSHLSSSSLLQFASKASRSSKPPTPVPRAVTGLQSAISGFWNRWSLRPWACSPLLRQDSWLRAALLCAVASCPSAGSHVTA